jgi:hypothetical protein
MIYQNGIYTVQRCDYYQQLAARENGDMAFLRIYQNGIYTVQATTSPLRIHPGTWHSSMYISDGIYTVPPLATSTCTREKYTQGHGIPPCIYQNGLCRDYQQLVPQGRNIPGTWHSSMYQNGIYGAA